MIEILGIGRHDRLRTLLSSYIDGEVSPAEAARVESHLSGCEECRRDLENLRATVGLLGAMPELELPRSFLLIAEPEPVRRSWAIQWGGALATAAAAAVFLALIAGDMSGLFQQTGLDARGDAASVAVTAEVAVAADTAAAPVAAYAAEEPVAESFAVPQATLESEQVGDLDDSVSDAADSVEEAAVAMAAPAPAVSSLEEPAMESTIAPQAAAASRSSEEPMEGADLMPFAGSETPVFDTSIDVAKELAKGISASDEAEDVPAPALAAEAPASDDDTLVSDAAEPQLLTFGTSVETADAGDGDEDDTAISLPLRQLQIAAGALLALLLAATLALMMRRRRAL